MDGCRRRGWSAMIGMEWHTSGFSEWTIVKARKGRCHERPRLWSANHSMPVRPSRVLLLARAGMVDDLLGVEEVIQYVALAVEVLLHTQPVDVDPGLADIVVG